MRSADPGASEARRGDLGQHRPRSQRAARGATADGGATCGIDATPRRRRRASRGQHLLESGSSTTL